MEGVEFQPMVPHPTTAVPAGCAEFVVQWMNTALPALTSICIGTVFLDPEAQSAFPLVISIFCARTWTGRYKRALIVKTLNGGNNNVAIDVHTLPDGYYTLTLSKEGTVVHKKVCIVN